MGHGETMRVKEYFEWTVGEKLYMPDMHGASGIDIFHAAGYEFVKWKDTADLGISKNGEACLGVPIKKTLLLAFEPPSQLPWIRDPESLRRWGAAISTIRTPGLDHFYIPRAFNHVPRYFNEPKTELLCMIGRDMGINGHPEHDLTIKRRELIAYFADKLGPKDFHLHGRWTPNRCYLGEPGPTAHGLSGYNIGCPITAGQTLCWDGKFPIFAKHKFTLALENSIWPGYYGCKAIEAMQCGSIPLYIGDPEIDNHTPKDVYIDMRGRTADELLAIITSMSEDEIAGYRNRIWEYLHKEGNDIFSSVTFAHKLVKGLQAIP
jgi:hypothetical protein